MSKRFAVVIGLVVLTGCTGPEQRGEVEGTVRVNGQPLANVVVAFVADGDQGRKATRSVGQTDAQGHYRLRAEDGRDGVRVGAYRVVIEDLAVQSAPRAGDGTVLVKPAPRFAPRFGDLLRTPLRKQVETGAQTLDLDLAAPAP